MRGLLSPKCYNSIPKHNRERPKTSSCLDLWIMVRATEIAKSPYMKTELDHRALEPLRYMMGNDPKGDKALPARTFCTNMEWL